MQIKFKKLLPNARIPFHGSDGAAGYDLYCAKISELGYGFTVCETGIAVEIPHGFFGAVYARSSIYKAGCEIANGVSVIDSDYRGGITLIFKRSSSLPIAYGVGERIAQLVIQPCASLEFLECEELSETPRGSGGYGSTGKS